MRKIESEMNAAIKSKINFSKANTSVSYDADANESNVYLHGNHIATAGPNFLHIFDGGWQSVTTKSRLNALINEFCDAFTCGCLLYTSPSPRDGLLSRMPSSA